MQSCALVITTSYYILVSYIHLIQVRVKTSQAITVLGQHASNYKYSMHSRSLTVVHGEVRIIQ
jgi:hypothetical protein